METVINLNEALKAAIEKGDQYNIGFITSQLIVAIDEHFRKDN